MHMHIYIYIQAVIILRRSPIRGARLWFCGGADTTLKRKMNHHDLHPVLADNLYHPVLAAEPPVTSSGQRQSHSNANPTAENETSTAASSVL